MGLLENLKELGPEASVYQEFLLNNKPKNRTIHAFFEGNDDLSFYHNFIEQIILNDIAQNQYSYNQYSCGNKSCVYKLHQKVSSRTNSNSRALFFVDKDLSNFLNEVYFCDNSIYVTNYYSIENFVVTEHMLQRIWKEIFHINSLDLDFLLKSTDLSYNLVANQFTQELKKFHYWMISIIAWIIYTRKKGQKPNLNNINLSKIFYISSDLKISRKVPETHPSTLKYLEQVSGVSISKGAWLEILAEARKLREELQPKTYIRGKYELWFLVQFLDQLTNRLRDLIKKSGKPFNVRTKVSQENAIEILGPRVLCPESLKNFLVKHKI
jgi:predicted DNA-binding protein (MmcQ/YjbR family)